MYPTHLLIPFLFLYMIFTTIYYWMIFFQLFKAHGYFATVLLCCTGT